MKPNAQRPTLRSCLTFAALSASVMLPAQQAPPDFFDAAGNPALSFWKNEGQLRDNLGVACPDVLYASSGSPLNTFLQDSSRVTFAVTLRDTSATTPDTILNIRMLSAGPGRNYASPEPWGERGHVRHYYVPHTAPNGVTAISGFEGITYPEFIKDVDLSLHSRSSGPVMTLTCRPGFNPNQVMLGFEGQDSLKVDVEGALKIWRDGKFIKLNQVRAFQLDAQGVPQPLSWNAEYLPDNGLDLVRFEFDAYDTERPLYLQAGQPPTAADEVEGLCWSSYLGDANEEYIYVSETDTAGNYFVAGVTNSAYSFFPNAPGIVLQFANVPWPIFVTRFYPEHRIAWTAFYGGNDGVDAHAYPNAMAVRSIFDGTDIYIGGEIQDNGLYIAEKPGAYNDSTGTAGGVVNGFVAQFDIDGILRWSTYLGNYYSRVHGLDLDSLGRLVIAGGSQGTMPQPANQPPGAYIRPHSGGVDGFIIALDVSDNLRYTTHVGDEQTDRLWKVQCHGNRIIAVGTSDSPGFEPILDGGANAYDQPDYADGGGDLVLVEFTLDGDVQWGTFIGWEGIEYVDGKNILEIGPSGNIVFVAATNQAVDVVPGVGWHQYTESDQVIFEFGQDRSRTWTSYLASGPNRMDVQAVRIDANGNIHVAGRILAQAIGESPLNASADMNGIYFQDSSIKGAPMLGADAFLMTWTPDHYLILATYFGGEERQPPFFGGFPFIETINSIALAPTQLYLSGSTSKVAVPDTSFFPLFNPGNDAWFQTIFNAQVPNGTDAFVTAICIDAFTGLADVQTLSTPAVFAMAIGTDQWVLGGLPDGNYRFSLFDAEGRLAREASLPSSQGRSSLIDTSELGQGGISGASGPARTRLLSDSS
ncbi:MAG: hypothetical protein IPF41_00555 [Flavobacteriales bacterium]|nr:hypothetical protein [Flavobacteriales bacterium]